MDPRPGPVALHPTGNNGFKHATSEHIYDFVNLRTNLRETHISALKDMDPMIDTHNRKREVWERERRILQKPILRETNTDHIYDYNETAVLQRSVGHFARKDGQF
jgi:short-subunit dehydrogenase involved in D-alanine esterification of teichoic acids